MVEESQSCWHRRFKKRKKTFFSCKNDMWWESRGR